MSGAFVLHDALNVEVVRLPRAAYRHLVSGADCIVYRGRVFRSPTPDPGAGDLRLVEVSTLCLETPFVCPACSVERADYEGEPGRYLPTCPNCGSMEHPIPCGLSFNTAKGHGHVADS